MPKLPCKYYLLENRAILISSEDAFFMSKKLADCPFPDSLLSFAYFDLRQWEEKFHEADRALMQYYKTRKAALLDPVRLVVNAFQNAHPFFTFLGLGTGRGLQGSHEAAAAQGIVAHSRQSGCHAAADPVFVSDGSGR